jgi:hypothetical protein
VEPTSILVLVAFAAAVYFLTRKEDKPAAVKPTPAPVPTAPDFRGAWVFDIIPPDHSKWGDGNHPDEKIPGKAEARGDWAPGLKWRLEGSGNFTRTAEGYLSGMAHVCGAPVAIRVQVPINGGAVGFLSDGVYLELHFAGNNLLGIVYEPHDKANKRGDIVGRKV